MTETRLPLSLYILFMDSTSNTVVKEVLIEMEKEKIEDVLRTITSLMDDGKVIEK